MKWLIITPLAVLGIVYAYACAEQYMQQRREERAEAEHFQAMATRMWAEIHDWRKQGIL